MVPSIAPELLSPFLQLQTYENRVCSGARVRVVRDRLQYPPSDEITPFSL